MSKRSTQHATFVIERDYAAAPARVFAAWAEPKATARWFVGPDEWEKSDHKDVFLDGIDNVAAREQGTRDLLDNLEMSLGDAR